MSVLAGKYWLITVAGLLVATVTLGAPPTPQDGPAYTVGAIRLEYLQDHPKHPPLADVARSEVVLGVTERGYVAPREDLPTVTLTIAEITE